VARVAPVGAAIHGGFARLGSYALVGMGVFFAALLTLDAA
jgi:hypothetical protein